MALIHAELTATCNSLGCAGAEKYCLDPQCSEAIRDLIKFLRRDGDDHETRRYLGSANIVETDLLPILVEYPNKTELFDLIIRLLVNLTTPALLIFNEQPPAEKTQRQHYLQMVLHLQKYKRAFTDLNVWRVIVDKLAEVIQAEYHEKGEEKVLSTVRLLILVRNILHVPADDDAECRPDNDANLHDQVLWAMHQSQLIDIIMYIACSDNEQQYYLHALEIISLMLRDQNAAELANSSVNRTETEKQRDEHELKTVLEYERKEKMEKLKKYSGSRHSRFGGRFVVSGMKSIGDNDMVVSSMTSNVNKAFDRYKKPVKTPKNRMPLKGSTIERKSAFSVRLFLKEFCVEFLHGAYNTLMKHVREILVRSKGQPNDESYYFWSMQFFMEFNRNYKFEIKLISETMSLHIFHFVQERIEESREKMISDKKKIPVWSKRMHLGLKAYKELVETLLVMYQSKDPKLQSSARTILTNLFYMVEYRDLILGLLSFYEEVKFSRLYLKDLIETNHIFMKLLEHLGKKQRNLVVLCKAKKKTSKKSKPVTRVDPDVDDDSMWTDLSSDLRAVIQTHDLVVDAVEARPYDPVSDVPMEDQKVEAMRRIRMHVRNKRLEESVKLLRASREVWPEDGYFGKPGLNNDEEMDILKEIFFADLGMPTGNDENVSESNNENDNEHGETDEDEEESSQVRMEEANFEFMDFVKKFAKPRILQSYCQLLKEFDRNSTYTNHAVVKFLHRITFDCKYSALMFQSSVFRVFQKIFVSKNPSHKELKNFAIFIMRKFTEVATKNKKVFIELLFWKDLKVAYEIEEGYDADENKKATGWSEEQEDELHRLHEEYVRDMPEEDELSWICRNLINQERSKVGVSKKLKQLGIVPIKRRTKPNCEFSEAEIVQITQLVQEFREASDPMRLIMEKLNVQRSKKHVIDKILELGLVQDRKELRKKKSKNTNKSGEHEYHSSDESNDEDDAEPIYHSLTSVYVLNAIKKVMDKNMEPALLWLIESLDDAADDLDVDEADIPLLPLTDECMTAVNDIDFQEAMTILGIHRPSGIQETYWRIPGRWQANDIRQRSIAIKNVIEGNFVVEDHNNTRDRVEDSSDEDVEATFDKIRKSLAQNHESVDEETTVNKDNTEYSDSKNKEPLDDSSDDDSPMSTSIVKLKKKKALLKDSEEEESDTDNVSFIKKKKMMLEDSEDEDAPIENKVPSNNRDDSYMDTSSVQGKKKILLEDSEEEENNTKNISMKNKKIMWEDSEDEDTPIENKVPLDNRDDSDMDTNIVPRKKKILLENSDEEENNIDNISTEKKKMMLEDSEDEDVLEDSEEKENISMKKKQKKKLMLDDSEEEDAIDVNKTSDLIRSGSKEINSVKRKPLQENSDSEEDIGASVKKTKYINSDSD